MPCYSGGTDPDVSKAKNLKNSTGPLPPEIVCGTNLPPSVFTRVVLAPASVTTHQTFGARETEIPQPSTTSILMRSNPTASPTMSVNHHSMAAVAIISNQNLVKTSSPSAMRSLTGVLLTSMKRRKIFKGSLHTDELTHLLERPQFLTELWSYNLQFKRISPGKYAPWISK